jgi:hypothetical protein
MAYGSGLSAQIGVAPESTVGTQVTPPTRFYEFLDESFQFVPTFLDSQGLKAGQTFKRVTRTVQSRFDSNGGFTVEHSDQGGMGLLWKHALGSAITVPTVIGATTAFKQIHTPGPKTGLALSVQVGRPQTDGTVRAFTYRGSKVTQWDFSVSDNAIAQLKLTTDGWQQDTAAALGGATFTAGAGVFSFADANVFKLGGTASTASGEMTVASGVTVTTVVTGVTITHKTPVADSRYGVGNAGIKKEQVENAIPELTITLDGEFTQRTEIYDLMVSNTTTALELDLSHGDAGGGNPYLLSFIMPAVKVKSVTPQVSGPDIVKQSVTMEAYDDGSGTNAPVQVKLVSKDTTL